MNIKIQTLAEQLLKTDLFSFAFMNYDTDFYKKMFLIENI